MVMTFKTYLAEATNSGNYVCINVDPSTKFDLPYTPSSGVPVDPSKRHVTLVYSRGSRVDPAKVLSVLNAECHQTIVTTGVKFAAFDSIPKEGERDENKATMVVKLDSQVLHDIHAKLLAMGMEHSYPEFSPHVSLYYEMDRDECHAMVDQLNNKGVTIPSIILQKYHSDYIDENWVSKLKR